MTQAFNLAQFANNLNTSGATSNAGLQNSAVTVTAGTGLSGGGSVALGSSVTLNNAGVTSVTAGSGISVSASTGGVTISTSGGGGVTSLNGQTGAITNTTFDSIGSVGWLAYTGSSNITAGTTVAGSSLYYATSITASFTDYYFSQGSNLGPPPNTYWYTGFYGRKSGGNTGYQVPANASTVSGTWRIMHSINGRSGGFNPCDNVYDSAARLALFVRVS